MRPELNCCRKSPQLLTSLKEKALSQCILCVCVCVLFVKCTFVLVATFL